MPETILSVDDDEQMLGVYRRTLDKGGYRFETATRGAQGLERLANVPVDLVLLDLNLPDKSGLEVLAELRRQGHRQPVLMISGEGNVQNAVRALREGALDFLEKPISPDRLLVSVQNALRLHRLEQENAALLGQSGAARLLGKSRRMEELRQLIAKAGPTESRVLITGEHGTGKELVAEALHLASRRHGARLVKVNCAAIPDNLVESELFGHERGAFTGATATRRGRFEVADGGTLFLDEIGDMAPATQVKVLRAIQQGEIERVGANDPIKVDIRFIAATNRDLETMMREGTFREDLYYRLNVMRLEMPPLRERKDDLPELAQAFVAANAARHGKPVQAITPAALTRLGDYDFPGNVRELQNIIERLVILAEGPEIGAIDVGRVLPAAKAVDTSALSETVYKAGSQFHELMDAAQRQIIQAALAEHGNRMAETARALGLERSHFYKKCKALGID